AAGPETKVEEPSGPRCSGVSIIAATVARDGGSAPAVANSPAMPHIVVRSSGGPCPARSRSATDSVVARFLCGLSLRHVFSPGNQHVTASGCPPLRPLCQRYPPRITPGLREVN